ncbi:hypothetical protein ES703_125253 [subsurface metagenome]
MAKHGRKIARGCRFYWKDRSAYVWIEMGRKRAKTFCSTNLLGKWFLLKIPQPWGAMAYALAWVILDDIENNMGKRGLWVKFGLQGYVRSKKRTKRNWKKPPSKW